MGAITFVLKKGYATAKVFTAEARKIPSSYIGKWAARRETQAVMETARAEDAAKAALSAVRHSASAAVKAKRFYNKKEYTEEYALGKTYTARKARQKAQRAWFLAQEKEAKAKYALTRSRDDWMRMQRARERQERAYEKVRQEKLVPEVELSERIRTAKMGYAKRTWTKRAWYVYYEIGMCPHSPPCEEEDTTWESRIEYISSQRDRVSDEAFEMVVAEIKDRGTETTALETRKFRLIEIYGKKKDTRKSDRKCRINK